MPHGSTARDAKEFRPEALAELTRAAADLRLLLGRGYGMRESLELVGNHFRLTKRQRQFLYRCVSPPEAAARRRAKLVPVERLAGARLLVDGYNCLIVTEYALARGVVLVTDDGLLRDVQGVFGAYRVSEHTERAIALLTAVLVRNTPRETLIYLDERMRHTRTVAERWSSELTATGLRACVTRVDSADRSIQEDGAEAIVASSDRANVDAAQLVVDLPRAAVAIAGGSGFLELPPTGPSPPPARKR